jgi:hypothetical protein
MTDARNMPKVSNELRVEACYSSAGTRQFSRQLLTPRSGITKYPKREDREPKRTGSQGLEPPDRPTAPRAADWGRALVSRIATSAREGQGEPRDESRPQELLSAGLCPEQSRGERDRDSKKSDRAPGSLARIARQDAAQIAPVRRCITSARPAPRQMVADCCCRCGGLGRSCHGSARARSAARREREHHRVPPGPPGTGIPFMASTARGPQCPREPTGRQASLAACGRSTGSSGW